VNACVYINYFSYGRRWAPALRDRSLANDNIDGYTQSLRRRQDVDWGLLRLVVTVNLGVTDGNGHDSMSLLVDNEKLTGPDGGEFSNARFGSAQVRRRFEPNGVFVVVFPNDIVLVRFHGIPSYSCGFPAQHTVALLIQLETRGGGIGQAPRTDQHSDLACFARVRVAL
jgi:hypothetical protein